MDTDTLHDLTAAYALDALDEHEVRAYEEHLAHCERCRAELPSLTEAAASLAVGVDAPPPPPELRERILDAARAERSNVVPLRPRWVVPAALATAGVAAAAAIVLAVWASSLSGKLDRERTRSAQQLMAAAIVAQPGARRIPLAAGRGTLVVSKTGQAALVLNRLGRAPDGKTYEAWVIERGKPLPAGLFAGGGDVSLVRLSRGVPDGAVVAVTVEREGGVAQPTGAPVLSARMA
jgi:anti-sigma-K factor RskA